jgi:hypothetical protein
MDEQFVKRRLQLPRYRLIFRPPAAVALCEKNPERECCDLIKQIAQGGAKSNKNPVRAGVEFMAHRSHAESAQLNAFFETRGQKATVSANKMRYCLTRLARRATSA